jgi:hypothetical protein
VKQQAKPSPIVLECLGARQVVQVACGLYHTVCLTADGLVFSWGRNIEVRSPLAPENVLLCTICAQSVPRARGRSFSSSWVMLDQSPAARLQRLRRKSTLHRSSRVWRTCPCNRSRADAITRPFSRVRPAHYIRGQSQLRSIYPNLGGLSRSCGRDHGMGVGRAKGSEAGRGPVGSSHQAARLRGVHNHCPHLRRSRYVIRTPASYRVDLLIHSCIQVYTWEARKLGQAGYAPQLVEALQDKGVVKVLNAPPLFTRWCQLTL